MREFLVIDQDTLSMNLSVLGVLPRDFEATEEFLYGSANLLHSYARFLNASADPTVDDEQEFTAQVEQVLRVLSE